MIMLSKSYFISHILFMIFTLINFNSIKAIDKDRIYMIELNQEIMSGDGSFDNQCEVDYNKEPLFKELKDEINKEVLSSIGDDIKLNDISTLNLYKGILKGKKHTGQINGGYWKYLHKNRVCFYFVY